MTIKDFKEEYAKLNKSQKEAVDSIEGPVMVIAGPGTGKTTILTLRIANILLRTDTPPSGILALTFTEAGAKAMRMKLKEIIGERAFEVPIHTFHGFAASIITEFSEHFPHLSRSRQITDIESETLIRDILKEKRFNKLRPGGEPDFYVSKIIKTISDSKQEAWTPDMLKSFAEEEIERVKTDPESISSRGETKGKLKAEAQRRIEKSQRTVLFAGVYEAYEERKTKERKMDYDDLIFELLKAIKEDKLLLQILQERYLYILVDEHQDTNDSQNLIIRAIADFFESPNLFVVGDEKQAIYRFQGASVENFLGFQKIWSGMKIISLTDNYRSHQGILDASFSMIEQNYDEDEYKELRVKLLSGKGEKGGPLDIVEAPDTYAEDSYLVESLRKISKEEPDKTVAIIVRRNSDATRIFSLLEENDVEASAERGANIFSHPVGSLFFSLLEFLADSSKTEALAKTFAGGLWGLDFSKQAELIKAVRSGNIEEISSQIPAIGKLKKEAREVSPIGSLLLAADISGLTALASRKPLGTEVWRGIFALAEDLARSHEIEDPKDLFEELLAYKKSADQRSIKIKTGASNSKISIMTAHGSKGLEFDYVFLPYAVEEAWISKNRASFFVLPQEKEEGDNIRDERRLFYVSITRARKHVFLSYPIEDDLGKILTPLRFLDELDPANISKKTLPKADRARDIQSIEKIESLKAREKTEHGKRVILENGISATSLNCFANCPSEFLYKIILRLPEPPSPSSEKGNAMHEAIANTWKERKNRGEQSLDADTISGIIEQSVKQYMKRSFLPLFEKEAVLEELVSNAPVVAKALTGHFNEEGSVMFETWVESDFESSYAPEAGTKKETVPLILHGRLDAFIEKDGKIPVFEYKTREAMSLAAIRGEVKSSGWQADGNYFRQLIFYKMLLENSLRFKDKIAEPALVFVKPDAKGRCPVISVPIEREDIERVKSEIETMINSVWSGRLWTETCDDRTCKYCAWKKMLD